MQQLFSASNRGSAQGTGWLRRISRRYHVVRCNRGRTPEKIQCSQGTAGSKELRREDTCVSFSTTLSFLGFEVSSEGIKPEQKHVQKLLQLQPPKDVKEVEAFVGLINYFGGLLQTMPHRRDVSMNSGKKTPCKWTDKCQRTFQSLVDELACEPLVQPYTLDKEVTPTTDASEKNHWWCIDAE